MPSPSPARTCGINAAGLAMRPFVYLEDVYFGVKSRV